MIDSTGMVPYYRRVVRLVVRPIG